LPIEKSQPCDMLQLASVVLTGLGVIIAYL